MKGLKSAPLKKCGCTKQPCTCSTKSSSTKPQCVREPKKQKARLQVQANVGWGNVLFMRGEGGSLNWDKGIALKNTEANSWHWEGETKETLTFKLLINDEQWCDGENYILKPGQSIKIKPTFQNP